MDDDPLPTFTVPVSKAASSNIVRKLFSRELYGSTSGKKQQRNDKIFDRIPSRLRFCLMDIVPKSYLRHHIFMGFSQCGQFLLSFVFHRNGRHTHPYRDAKSYRLHFLSWVPGRLARSVHSVPLFDDEAVENCVSVSMAQWKHNPNILVVYGIAEGPMDRSYLSVIGVPSLGCKKCISLSNNGEGDLNCYGNRCLEHNFAVHTKFYCPCDLDQRQDPVEPVVQLTYANEIIIYTDYLHILQVDYVKCEQNDNAEEKKIIADISPPSVDTNPGTPMSESSASCPSPKVHSTVVQNILNDFAELEMETTPMTKPVQLLMTGDMMGQELCIQASSISQSLQEEWEGPSPSIRTLISPPLRSPRRRPAEGLSRFNEMHRIIAEKTYEFSEETEPKCEKLSIFRKRRLADKKYEFSEDNNENIVPFRVLRSNRKYFIGSTSKGLPRRPKTPPIESVVLRVHNKINTATTDEPKSPASERDSTGDLTSLERDSTGEVDSLERNSGNDRALLERDCTSELGSLEQDSANELEYRVTAMADDGSMKTISVHDNTSKTVSDCVVSPQDPYLVHSGNSKCMKSFTRHFVESDDDITSIITDSEDDCLSGYHVALPLTAHGAGYAPLQAIGLGAWERLRCDSKTSPPTLRARQRSLDIELLCNEVCIRLCRLNGKKFIYCFDWGCHVIDVCQSSGCLCGACAMWLWASEGAGDSARDCETCKDAGCLLHRRQYAAECLFVWDLVSGDYRTEHATMREDGTAEASRPAGADRARQLARCLAPFVPVASDNRILTTQTGRSLHRLTDVDHCIEITKKHPDSSDSESEEEDSESIPTSDSDLDTD